MNVAYTADYKIISAKQAVKGQSYFCPVCNGKLQFFSGKINIPHFRHGKGVSNETKAYCELYSKNFEEHTMYEYEYSARQKVRLLLAKNEEGYVFSLKFPLIKQENVNMLTNNLYFSYQCKQLLEFKLNTVHLLLSRKNNEYVVPLLKKYSLFSSNEQYEKMLGLKISGDYVPFENGPLIFKEIQGEYISIPYRRITLSGKFFVVSKRPLISLHKDLILIKYENIEELYIYEFIMPTASTEDFQNWFTRILNYSLLAATCHLDLISPVDFKKVGTIIEISSSRSVWQLTNIGERPFEQRLIIIDPKHHRKVISVSNNQKIELNLTAHGEYLIYLDQEISEFTTVRYVPFINYNRSNIGEVKVNDNNILFKIHQLNINQITIQSDLPMIINSNSELFYAVKKGAIDNLKAPIRIDFPRLWSLNVKKSVKVSDRNLFNELLDIYEKYYLYPKMICELKDINLLIKTVNESEFKYKDKLCFLIRRFGVRIPQRVSELINRMRDSE